MAIKGQESPDLKSILDRGIISVLLAILGIAAFTLVNIFAAPFVLSVIATAIFAGSMVYMMGISYGILNDILACRKNLPYFLLGHQDWQHSVIHSNKPGAQAVAWGILATSDLSLIAGALFTIATLIAGFFVPVATFVLPIMMLAIPLIVLAGDKFADYGYDKTLRELQLNEKGFLGKQNNAWQWIARLNNYQTEALEIMCPTNEDKAAWFANGYRNGFGYVALPILGLVALTGVCILAGISHLLPAILFSSLFSAVIPGAIAAIVVIAVVAGLVYLALNHDKQIDNQFKLDFGNAESLAVENSLESAPNNLLNLLGDDLGKTVASKFDTEKGKSEGKTPSSDDSFTFFGSSGQLINTEDNQNLVDAASASL